MKSVLAITIHSGAHKDSFGIQPHWQTEASVSNQSYDQASSQADEFISEFARDISSMSDDVLAHEEMQIVDHFFDENSDSDGGVISIEDGVSEILVARELPNVCLKEMFMEGADFAGAHLHNADFTRARLRMADFSGASLTGAHLSQAILTFADLSGADLRKADLRNAELTKANLAASDLRGARLGGANLHFVDLREADLRGADLNATNLKTAKVAGARFDSTTTLPISFEAARELGMKGGIHG